MGEARSAPVENGSQNSGPFFLYVFLHNKPIRWITSPVIALQLSLVVLSKMEIAMVALYALCIIHALERMNYYFAGSSPGLFPAVLHIILASHNDSC